MSEKKIIATLVEHGKVQMRRRRHEVAFTGDKQADKLLNDLEKYPHAFVLACVMDRQIKAELAWKIPNEIKLRLGTFAFKELAKMKLKDFKKAFVEPYNLHRFSEIMAEAFYEGVQRIGSDYDGNASKIWEGKLSSAEAVYRFLKFKGVGPKIATMAVNILTRDFKIKFSDYYSVDISADVHVRRVFSRLGLTDKNASIEEVIYKARAMYPEFPGLLDLTCWEIGRHWCRPNSCACSDCYMVDSCPSSGVS